MIIEKGTILVTLYKVSHELLMNEDNIEVKDKLGYRLAMEVIDNMIEEAKKEYDEEIFKTIEQ